MSHLEDARRIGQLEATLKMLPHTVMFSPHFENVPVEERLKVSKALELVISDKFKQLEGMREVK
jgi:hypothetical protein